MGYSQSLMYSYHNKYVGLELIGAYTYADNPVYETIFVEGDKIVNTIENQKDWQRLQVQATLNIHPFGQYLYLQVRPRFPAMSCMAILIHILTIIGHYMRQW